MKRSSRYAIWIGYWILLGVSTHLPPGKIPAIPPGWGDKSLHLLTFMLLGLLMLWALQIRHSRNVLKTFVFPAVYGIVDELTQPAFGRTADLQDWLADLAGITLGLTIFWCCLQAESRRLKSANAIPGSH